MSTPFQGTQGSNIFQPTAISGCQFWLDAADSSSLLLSGTSILQWSDKSGCNNHVYQGTSLNQPTYNSNYTNGLGSVLFTPNQWLQGTLNMNTYTRFLVYSNAVINIGAAVIDGAGYLQTGGSGIFQDFVGYNNGIVFSTDGSFRLAEAYLPVGGGSSSALWINASPISLSFQVPSGTYSFTTMNIGRRSDGVYFTGAVAEIVTYNRQLTTSEMNMMEGYLAWKWGIQGLLPSNHPYRNGRVSTNLPYTANPRVPYVVNNPVFSPTQLSGCQLWLDGADPLTLSLSTTTVTQWRDKSGKGYNGNITSGANGPSYSNRAVQFRSASSQSLTLAQGLGNAMVNTTLSIFFVGARRGTGFDYFLATGRDNTGEGPNVGFNGDTMLTDIYGVILIPPSTFYFTAPIPAYAGASEPTRIYNYGINASFYDLVMNGTTLATLNTSTRPTALTNPQLGSRYAPGGAAAYHNNDINEMIIYVPALSTAQRQQVEGYLAWKWGLTASLPDGHPYKTPPLAPFSFGIRQAQQNKWLPTQVSGCQLWLDAADRATITAATTITGWTDKSGNNKTVTFAGASNTYNATTLSVNTDNATTSYFFANVNLKKSQVTYANVFTVHTWTGSALSGTNQGIWGQDNGGGWNRLQLLAFNAVPSYSYGLSYTSTSPNLIIVSGLNTANRILYSATYAYQIPNGTFAYLNGSLASSVVTEAAASTETTTTNTYFGTIGDDKSFSSTIAFNEILIYTSNLTTFQRQQIEGYLAWKWRLQGSLPVTHPYKLFPPSP